MFFLDSKHSKLYYFMLLSTNSVLKLKLTFGPKYPITLCLNISKSIQLQNSEDEHFKLLIMLLYVAICRQFMGHL